MLRSRIGALIAVSAIAFAACQGASTPSPSAGASEGVAKDGGTLVVALPGDIKRTDPALIDDSNTSYVMMNVVEGLVRLKAGHDRRDRARSSRRAGRSRTTA